MWEGAPASAHDTQNGHGDKAVEHGALPAGEPPRGQPTGGPGNGRVMPEMVLDASAEIFGDRDEVLRPYGSETPGDTGSMAASDDGGAFAEEAGPQGRGTRRLAGEMDDDTARGPGQSPSARAYADAEELLSRAHVHAARLRLHADVARAEAEALRAEAAALRRSALDEAAAISSRAEALSVDVHARAEEIRSATEGQADAARAEIERLGKEVASLRRLLHTELDASRASTLGMRAEIQGLWTEIQDLSAELRLLSRRGAAQEELALGTKDSNSAAPPPESDDAEHVDVIGGMTQAERPGHESSQAEAARRAVSLLADLGRRSDGRLDEEGPAATASPRSPHGAEAGTHPGPGPLPPQLDVGELLKEIWDVAYTQATRRTAPGFQGQTAKWAADEMPNGAAQEPWGDDPVTSYPERPRTSEPLIGSGGWHASTAVTPNATPEAKPVGAQMPRPSSGRRSFRRRR